MKRKKKFLMEEQIWPFCVSNLPIVIKYSDNIYTFFTTKLYSRFYSKKIMRDMCKDLHKIMFINGFYVYVCDMIDKVEKN